MSEEFHKRVEALYQRALDLPESERAAFIERESRGDATLYKEVETLLAHHDVAPADFLDRSAVSRAPAVVPDSIGPYLVERVLGEGGMGTVYLAEQREPIRRAVAVKVLRTGLQTKDVVARFESERQALALLNHPNIAQVFDAGTTDDGLPYFAMEFIEGPSLADFCDTNQQTVRDRLELFMQVCEGVQHAHQEGIIHRDLKPGNIIVSSVDGRPVPKIIDFGIAKAIERKLTAETLLTRDGQFVGTPEYMSPEQADGSAIGSRTDVYSLGVILYELLTGTLPFSHEELRAAGFEAMLKRIREVDPPRPSERASTHGAAAKKAALRRRTEPRTLARTLSGDLDWITMKALEKNAARRYASAAAFSDDLRRYIDHQPVSARAPSAMYRARKFMRRHAVGVAVVSTAFIATIAFAVSMAVQAGRIASERDRANQEAESANQISEFLVGLFDAADPGQARGDTVTVVEVLGRGAASIREDSDLDPATRAQVMHVLGRVYRNLGKYDDAEQLLKRALEEMNAHGVAPDKRVEVLRDLGFKFELIADHETARRYYDEGLRLTRAHLGADADDSIYLLNRIGVTWTRSGEYETAQGVFQQALDACERTGPRNDEILASLLNGFGILQQKMGNLEKTTELWERSVAIYQTLYTGDHPRIAAGLGNLGYAYKDKGELDKALDFQRRGTEMCLRLYGENHRSTGNALNMQGAIQRNLENYEEAITLFRRAASAYANSIGPDHPIAAYPFQNLGKTYNRMGDPGKAVEYHERAIEIRLRARGPDHPDICWSQRTIGQIKIDMDDAVGAEPHLRDAVRVANLKMRPGHHQRTGSKIDHARSLVRLGRYDAAEAVLDDARSEIWDNGGKQARKEWCVRVQVALYEAWGKGYRAGRARAELEALQ